MMTGRRNKPSVAGVSNRSDAGFSVASL